MVNGEIKGPKGIPMQEWIASIRLQTDDFMVGYGKHALENVVFIFQWLRLLTRLHASQSLKSSMGTAVCRTGIKRNTVKTGLPSSREMTDSKFKWHCLTITFKTQLYCGYCSPSG